MRSSMSFSSAGLRVSSGTLWALAVAAIASRGRVGGAGRPGPALRRRAAPLAGDRRVDGQRLERGLDHAESQRSAGPLVVAGDQDAEVQFGQARGADGALERAGVVDADQHRRVEQRTHLREGVAELAGEAPEVLRERASSSRASTGRGKDTGIADVRSAFDPSGCGVYDAL
jgi:hypothetical protein